MLIRATPTNIDSNNFWKVEDSQENLILQENGLFPVYMDNQYAYYLITDSFVDKYVNIVEKYGILQKRKNDLERRIRH